MILLLGGILFLPETFKWGLTIDAMGYEGNLQADGAGPSFWNNFLAKVDPTNENGINHYYEYETDLAKAKELGANMYIVYVPWWRLAPSHTKAKNPAAFTIVAIKDVKTVELDGKTYGIKSPGKPEGMFGPQYYQFLLIPFEN